MDISVDEAMLIEVHGEGNLLGRGGQPSVEFSDGGSDGRGEESGPGFKDARWDGAEVPGEYRLPLLPVIRGRVVTCG